MAPTRTVKPPKFFAQLSPPTSSKKASGPKKIKWYLDQRGHMSQSRSALLYLRKLAHLDNMDSTDPHARIFSANTIPELVALLPQCLEFAGDFEAYSRENEIFYAVQHIQKMFTTFDEAADIWEKTREYHPNRVMLVTRSHDRAYWFGVPGA
ncbi:hypothetical protein B0H14DRAFT_3479325 [Mycena olivaceomarginata]|nr:hypothetical protein B0H14DRAFT_3479325 [Mycena olivaceomarginata]